MGATSGVVCPQLWTNYPRGRFFFFKNSVEYSACLRKNLMTKTKRKKIRGRSKPQEVGNEKNEL